MRNTADPARHLFAKPSVTDTVMDAQSGNRLKSLHFAAPDPRTWGVDFWDSKPHVAVAFKSNGNAGMQIPFSSLRILRAFTRQRTR